MTSQKPLSQYYTILLVPSLTQFEGEKQLSHQASVFLYGAPLLDNTEQKSFYLALKRHFLSK